MFDHTHLNLHGQFITFIYKKLHAQNQLCISFSRSQHHAQLGNALQKQFAYYTLIMSTLKGSTGRFFYFFSQSQHFTGGSRMNRICPNLPNTVKNQCQQKQLIYTSFER